MKAIVIVMLLSGCAQGFTGMCAFKYAGQTDAGIQYMAVQCQPSEGK